eukprot:TRINITY_DN67836_c9_g4_i2.p1 TRINITY_DN67836_c9_g4~~TRINITY_DN67836_c9_g4_i2.p1  ORF type:complete len:719 (-),score=70.12 TRINITY_DN67836_c9_g4_i2:256-2412(-)
MLQKFVAPCGKNNEVIQVTWSPSVQLIEKRVNVHKLGDQSLTTYEAAVTYEGPSKWSKQAYVSPNVMLQIKEMCKAIVSHIYAVDHLTVAQMVLYVKVDKDNTLWLLYPSVFRTVEKGGSRTDYPIFRVPPTYATHCRAEKKDLSHIVDKELKQLEPSMGSIADCYYAYLNPKNDRRYAQELPSSKFKFKDTPFNKIRAPRPWSLDPEESSRGMVWATLGKLAPSSVAEYTLFSDFKPTSSLTMAKQRDEQQVKQTKRSQLRADGSKLRPHTTTPTSGMQQQGKRPLSESPSQTTLSLTLPIVNPTPLRAKTSHEWHHHHQWDNSGQWEPSGTFSAADQQQQEGGGGGEEQEEHEKESEAAAPPPHQTGFAFTFMDDIQAVSSGQRETPHHTQKKKLRDVSALESVLDIYPEYQQPHHSVIINQLRCLPNYTEKEKKALQMQRAPGGKLRIPSLPRLGDSKGLRWELPSAASSHGDHDDDDDASDMTIDSPNNNNDELNQNQDQTIDIFSEGSTTEMNSLDFMENPQKTKQSVGFSWEVEYPPVPEDITPLVRERALDWLDQLCYQMYSHFLHETNHTTCVVRGTLPQHKHFVFQIPLYLLPLHNHFRTLFNAMRDVFTPVNYARFKQGVPIAPGMVSAPPSKPNFDKNHLRALNERPVMQRNVTGLLSELLENNSSPVDRSVAEYYQVVEKPNAHKIDSGVYHFKNVLRNNTTNQNT